MMNWLAQPSTRVMFGLGLLFFATVTGLVWSRTQTSVRIRDKLQLTRWTHNLSLSGCSWLLMQCLPIASIMVLLAELNSAEFGLLHWLDLSEPWSTSIALLMMDLAIYWQHRLFHRIPILWRLHRVHHTDTEFDTSLGLRFHPFEILLSFGFKLAVAMVLGMSAIQFAIYELLLMSFSLLTHSGVGLPVKIDLLLRKIIVTPDFHRVHHSIHPQQQMSNYGNFLSLWDHLFRSVQFVSATEFNAFSLGLTTFRMPKEQTWWALIMQPFSKTKLESITKILPTNPEQKHE